MLSNFISGLFLENYMKPCLQEKKGRVSKELLNIPISVSLLHEKEYENIIQSLNKKRRSNSEKRININEKNKIRIDTSIATIVFKKEEEGRIVANIQMYRQAMDV